MPELVVIAALMKNAPNQFTIVVSTAAVDADDAGTGTDVRIEDAASRREADRLLKSLVAEVVDRAERRGDRVRQVRWLEREGPVSD